MFHDVMPSTDMRQLDVTVYPAERCGVWPEGPGWASGVPPSCGNSKAWDDWRVLPGISGFTEGKI